MKSLILLLSHLATVNAGVINYPSLKADFKGSSSGNSNPLEDFDPELCWTTAISMGPVGLEAGVLSKVKPTLDITSFPKSLWAKVKGEISGWMISSKTDMNLQSSESINVKTSIRNNDFDTTLDITTSVSRRKLKISKGFDTMGGHITVIPSYDFKSSNADITFGFDTGKTNLMVEASPSNQIFKLSKQVTDRDRLTPSITSKGETALTWKRLLSHGNSITTQIKPNDSIVVKWKDGPWVATINSELEGFQTGKVDVRIIRKIDFL